MKKFRLGAALLILALVLALVPAAFAQDTLGASQGDFDLWTSANANFATISSVSYDFTGKFELAGMGDSNVSAEFSGTGVIDANKDNPAFQLDVTGNVVQGTDTTPVNLNVRIVDGIIYYNDGTGWKGEKMEDVASSLESGLGATSGLPVNPSDLQSGDLSSLSSNPEAEAAMQALSQLKPSDFLALTRTDESGQAHFTLNIDLAKLLASPAITSLMSTAASAGGSSGSTDAAQMQQGMMMAQMMFAQAKINVDQYVDPESKMVQRTTLTIALPLDSMVGPGAAVNLNFDINLSKYNEAVSVEAPAGATMMDSSSSS